jgi:glutamyl-tRNA synthetase
MPTGRFAPSPTGTLHIGNLRTALLAWLFARSSDSPFLLRVEDLDPAVSSPEHEARQLADLAELGIDHDGPVVHQSDRRDAHDEALGHLEAAGLTYPCYCSRREVREAAAAPHGPLPEGAYPGTCRELSASDRSRREREGRRPALRLRAEAVEIAVPDRLHGPVARVVDDLVLRRADGLVAYNLAVVVDDHDQGVQEVVRGDDLLDSTPRQAHLCDLLGIDRPRWAHVPLVLGPDGDRLAKRGLALGVADLEAMGHDPSSIVGLLAGSVGLAAPGERVRPVDLVDRFDPDALPREPWLVEAGQLAPRPVG